MAAAPSPEPARTPAASGHRFARVVLAISMFVMGGCGLAYEYTLGVLGNNLLGSSHEQIFVVIGLMLFAMGVGAGVQRVFVRDLVDAFLWIELALAVLGGASALLVYAAYVHTSSHQLVLYVAALGIGTLIGCEIPLLIRIHERWALDLRTNLSTTLALDYVGALVGALLFTYGLTVWLSVPRIATVLGLTNAALALLGLVAFRRLVRRPRTIAVAVMWAMVLLAWASTRADAWTARLEQRAFADPIVHSTTSRYQHVVLTRRDTPAGERVQMFLDGHLQWNSLDERIYHELLVHPALVLASRPVEHVLVLGGGDGLAVREIRRHPGVRRVTLVDLDPAVLDLARNEPHLVELNEAALLDARVHATAVLPEADDETGDPDRVLREVFAPTHRARDVGLGADEAPIPLAEVEVFALDADTFVRQLGAAAEDGGGHFDAAILDFPDPPVDRAREALQRRLLSQPRPQPRAGRPHRRAVDESLARAGRVPVDRRHPARRGLPRSRLPRERAELRGMGLAPGLGERPGPRRDRRGTRPTRGPGLARLDQLSDSSRPARGVRVRPRHPRRRVGRRAT
jgi:spermidine synthase